MSIPPKPWEVPGPGYGSTTPQPHSINYVSNTNRLHSSVVPFPGTGGGGGGGGTSVPTPAPPLPPRPGQQTRPIYSSSNSYSRMPYSSYANPMYANYSSAYRPYPTSYNNYSYGSGAGMYGSGMYGPPPLDGNEYPTFVQMAEESSAPTFQSIQSFVHAFGSISTALESTYHAVYSSFRAVIDVADHFGRVKEVLSSLAIFRFLRWIFRRIMYLIGISKIKPEQLESLWNSTAEMSNDGSSDWVENNLKPKKTTSPIRWPMMIYIGFMFLGSWLLWKLRTVTSPEKSLKDMKWASGESEHFLATAEYDFDSVMSDRELKTKKGQTLRLAPAAQQPADVEGWVLASDGVKIGLVPVNYIKVLGKRNGIPAPNIPSRVNPPDSPSSSNYTSQQQQPQPDVFNPLAQVTNSYSPSISRSSSESTLKADTPVLTKSFMDEFGPF